MKTIIMICLLFSGFNMNAQNYYSITKKINGNGYTYQCDVVKSVWVTLYNSNPIYVFRQIEVDIKKNIQYTITEAGKKFDFIVLNTYLELM